jgi:nucleoside-diphosphate-sugar epimerase
MERVAVSGATGFIGRQSIKFLKERGFEIHCLTSKDVQYGGETDVIWHHVDLLSGKECSEFFETISVARVSGEWRGAGDLRRHRF